MYYPKYNKGCIDVIIGEEFKIPGRFPCNKDYPIAYPEDLIELVCFENSYSPECSLSKNWFGSKIDWTLKDFVFKAKKTGKTKIEYPYFLAEDLIYCVDVYDVVIKPD